MLLRQSAGDHCYEQSNTGTRRRGRGGRAGVVGKVVRPTHSDEVASQRVNGKLNHKKI